jgi:hypothetical protein
MFCGEGRLCKGDASDRLVVTVWFAQKKGETEGNPYFQKMKGTG